MPIIGAIDQGTSSSRFLIFDSKTAKLLDSHQELIDQIAPKQSWLEEDPEAIYNSVVTCIETVISRQLKLDPKFKISAVGITNQRETTIIWDKISGKSLYNAILWCDGRTKETVDNILKKVPNGDKTCLQSQTGLPISTYFSALKVRWLLDNSESVRAAVESGTAMFGTVDSWLIYKLTNGQQFFTDATNASRTMLYDLNSNSWSQDLLDFFEIPKSLLLPEILPSSADFGKISGLESLKGVPICGVLGDQQAALVGQQCLSPGELKNTYGTGCFLLQNTGGSKIFSKSGLLTTVGYKKADGTIIYALEGSIAIAGLLIKWLSEKLGIIKDVKDLNESANLVKDSGGVKIVPAFGGLFCPYWDTTARGIICGLTQYSNKNHICRAALEAVAWQVRDVLEAMKNDGQECKMLKADGGMTNSQVLLQIQADILNVPVIVPEMKESTALGAATAAGCFIGEWEAKGWELFKSCTGNGSDSSCRSSSRNNKNDNKISCSEARLKSKSNSGNSADSTNETSESNSNEEKDKVMISNNLCTNDERSNSRDSSDADSAYQEEDQLKFNTTRPSGNVEYDYSKWKLAVEKSQGWA